MTGSWSPQINWQIIVLWFGGLRPQEIMRRLPGPKRRHVFRVISQWLRTGTIRGEHATRRRIRSDRVLNQDDEQYVMELVESSPFLFLEEFCAIILLERGKDISVPTLLRTFYKLQITPHKMQIQAKQISEIKRFEFEAMVQGIDAKSFVWLDEVGTNDQNRNRIMGWGIRGERVQYEGYYVRRQQLSSIAAMTVDGFLTHMTCEGTINSEKFLEFLHEYLLPCLNPHPGNYSIVVMDNLSVHRVTEIQDVLLQHGVAILYLPPYTPKFNPIELLFNGFKQNVRKLAARRADSPLLDLVDIAFNSVTPTHCRNYVRHCKIYGVD